MHLPSLPLVRNSHKMALLLLPEMTIISIRNKEFTMHDTIMFPALLWWYNLKMFLALHLDLTLQNILEQDFQVSRNLKRKFSGRKREPIQGTLH